MSRDSRVIGSHVGQKRDREEWSRPSKVLFEQILRRGIGLVGMPKERLRQLPGEPADVEIPILLPLSHHVCPPLERVAERSPLSARCPQGGHYLRFYMLIAARR